MANEQNENDSTVLELAKQSLEKRIARSSVKHTAVILLVFFTTALVKGFQIDLNSILFMLILVILPIAYNAYSHRFFIHKIEVKDDSIMFCYLKWWKNNELQISANQIQTKTKPYYQFEMMALVISDIQGSFKLIQVTDSTWNLELMKTVELNLKTDLPKK